MRSYAVGLLGLVFLTAAPAFANDRGQADADNQGGVTHQSSTYTPGPAEGSRAGTVRGFSTRNSAVQTARGGGPQDAASTVRDEGRAPGTDLSVSADATNPHGARGRIMSDNQTRRPGAANYTGRSFHTPKQKNGGEGRYVGGSARGGISTPSTHSVPEPAGVSMQGDNFAARTGSAVSGPIPVRAPESNERDTRAGWAQQGQGTVGPVPVARGGGPGAVRLPDGDIETPAPSGRIDYWHLDHAVRPSASPLTADDLRALPYPGDGTRRAGSGLLSSRTPDRSRQVTASPSALSTSTWNMTRDGSVPGEVPNPPTAIGGGPRRK